MSELLEQALRDAVHKNVLLRDLIVAAFVAETGCLPSECCLVQETQGNRIIWRIERAPPQQPKNRARTGKGLT